MHELTVALRLRQSLETELEGEAGIEVVEVGLDIGALAGIVPAALEFAWTHAVVDSPLLAQSKLDIEWIEAQGSCPTCQEVSTLTALQSLRCPGCGDPIDQVTAGDELDIRSVDVRQLNRAGR
jgi:hydrogenase nickel incorporation protein HypA/HybF